MIGLVFLAVREGFFMDIVVTGAIIAVIFVLIGNSILNKLGWTLW
jgi:hypothetical protein